MVKTKDVFAVNLLQPLFFFVGSTKTQITVRGNSATGAAIAVANKISRTCPIYVMPKYLIINLEQDYLLNF
jgi:hypothetical protein